MIDAQGASLWAALFRGWTVGTVIPIVTQARASEPAPPKQTRQRALLPASSITSDRVTACRAAGAWSRGCGDGDEAPRGNCKGICNRRGPRAHGNIPGALAQRRAGSREQASGRFHACGGAADRGRIAALSALQSIADGQLLPARPLLALLLVLLR